MANAVSNVPSSKVSCPYRSILTPISRIALMGPLAVDESPNMAVLSWSERNRDRVLSPANDPDSSTPSAGSWVRESSILLNALKFSTIFMMFVLSGVVSLLTIKVTTSLLTAFSEKVTPVTTSDTSLLSRLTVTPFTLNSAFWATCSEFSDAEKPRLGVEDNENSLSEPCWPDKTIR